MRHPGLIAAICVGASVAMNPVLTVVYTSEPRALASVPTLAVHPLSLSRVALYSYTIGLIGANFSLPPSPYGLNFTKVVQKLNSIEVTPVINCGGSNAEANWKFADVWSRVFTAEAVNHGYSGYVMDMEISHESSSRTQLEFVQFLDTFAASLAVHNMTLQVITKYDFPKSEIVKSNIQSILSYNYVSEPATLGYIHELTVKYPSKSGVMLEPQTSWNGEQFFESVATQTPYSCKHLALWSDLAGVSSEFLAASAVWLRGNGTR